MITTGVHEKVTNDDAVAALQDTHENFGSSFIINPSELQAIGTSSYTFNICSLYYNISRIQSVKASTVRMLKHSIYIYIYIYIYWIHNHIIVAICGHWWSMSHEIWHIGWWERTAPDWSHAACNSQRLVAPRDYVRSLQQGNINHVSAVGQDAC